MLFALYTIVTFGCQSLSHAPHHAVCTRFHGTLNALPHVMISLDAIGVNHPAIVREIPHFDVFPAFPHFSENVPHFWLYFEKQIFLIIVIILGARKKLCA